MRLPRLKFILPAVFFISQAVRAEVLPAPVISESAARSDAQKIKERYISFLIGTKDTFSGETGKKVGALVTARLRALVRGAMKADLGKDAGVPFMTFQEEPGFKKEDEVVSAMLERNVLGLAYGYTVASPGNAYYHDPKVLETYVRTLDYLYGRGIRSGMTFHYNRPRMRMDRAPQPAPGAANIARMELRMGAFAQSVLLMEPYIRDTKTFAEARETVRFLELLGFTSGHVRYYEPIENPPDRQYALQSDAMQNYSDTTLVSALLETDPKRRDEMLRLTCRAYEDSLKISPGREDTIKPDFTGYHHRGIYGNAYTGGFIPQAAFGLYLLKDTAYAPSAESVRNLCELAKTYRLYSQKYSMPPGIRGRFPSGGDTLKDEAFSGIVMLAAENGVDVDAMKPVFARLWDPGQVGYGFVFSGGRGKVFRGMGMLDMLRSLETRHTAPEPDPDGFWGLPYGGLALHRRSDWLAAFKGFSRYIWDYENGLPGENLYGQYLSHGTITLFTRGEPVSDIASGYDFKHGWDWYRMPGATAVHFPMKPTGPLRTHGVSPQTYLGSVTADGRDGAAGMILDNATTADGTRIGLLAHKSVFFVADFILMLGTDISGGDGVHSVETTLFQSVVPAGATFAFGEGDLSDPSGNRYYLPDTSVVARSFGRQDSFLENGKTPSSGNVALAWIDHGKSPKGAGYEVGIGIRGAAKRRYVVLSRDSAQHAVAFPDDRLVFQLMYRAGASAVKGAPVTRVDAPCMIMARTVGSGLLLGVTNPDLNMAPTVPLTDRHAAEDIMNPAKPAPVTLTLAGKWRLGRPSPGVKVVSQTSDSTVLMFACIDGKPVIAELQP